MDDVVCFVNTYLLNSDFSRGYCYPSFDQLGPNGLTSRASFPSLLKENPHFDVRTKSVSTAYFFKYQVELYLFNIIIFLKAKGNS